MDCDYYSDGPSMSSQRFNFTTDHHFSHRPPGRRQGDYFVDLDSKMRQVSSHCNSTNSIPLFGGDLFHLKDPSKIPTPTLVKFLGDLSNLLISFKTPPLCAIGNHDIRYDRLSTLPEQPLGLLAQSGVISLLCNYSLINLVDWEAPSGHTYLVEKTLSGHAFHLDNGSHVLVYSTPYIEDPQDLLAYIGGPEFHDALGNLAKDLLPIAETSQSVTGILLLHTLSGGLPGEFYGLHRADYGSIHKALAYSALGRATSAVLFGHEHPDLPEHALPFDSISPLSVNNLPTGYLIATTGTLYINPASFSRSSLDYNERVEDPERNVYMVDLVYTTSGAGLGLTYNKINIETRPITQLFGVSDSVDPLNQGAEVEDTPQELPVWTSFNDALNKLDNTGVDPAKYLIDRLRTESAQVTATVKTLLVV